MRIRKGDKKAESKKTGADIASVPAGETAPKATEAPEGQSLPPKAKSAPAKETPAAERNPVREAPAAQNGNMSVFVYILLLFSAALLLMCLSSLIHQRNNTEALGKLQSSVSVMQEVQNLQDKIIGLQDAQRALEERLKNAQSDWSEAVARAEAERKQAEALRHLYVIEAQYQAGDYEACQASVSEFEASGLTGNLPSESPANGVIAPSERYQQIQESMLAHIAEASQPPDAPENP